jgi:hypothetical protein
VIQSFETTLLNHLGTDGFALKLKGFGKFYVASQAGGSPEDWVHGRDHSYQNEVENQVHQFAGCPRFRLFGTWVLGCSNPIRTSHIKKTKRPGACARPATPKLVAGVRFELTTFGL